MGKGIVNGQYRVEDFTFPGLLPAGVCFLVQSWRSPEVYPGASCRLGSTPAQVRAKNTPWHEDGGHNSWFAHPRVTQAA